MSEELQRLPAEVMFQKEIDALIAAEKINAFIFPNGCSFSSMNNFLNSKPIPAIFNLPSHHKFYGNAQ